MFIIDGLSVWYISDPPQRASRSSADICASCLFPAPHLSSGQPPTIVWSIRDLLHVRAPKEVGTVLQQRLIEYTRGSDVFLLDFAFVLPLPFTEDRPAQKEQPGTCEAIVDFTEVTEGK